MPIKPYPSQRLMRLDRVSGRLGMNTATAAGSPEQKTVQPPRTAAQARRPLMTDVPSEVLASQRTVDGGGYEHAQAPYVAMLMARAIGPLVSSPGVYFDGWERARIVPRACPHTLGAMSRFREPQHPDFQRLNASIDFDRRLWPQDVAQSRAHARMLAARGIIAAEDRDALLAGLDSVESELREERFPFHEDDEDIHMAIERRLTESPGRSAASSTRPARATTRS